MLEDVRNRYSGPQAPDLLFITGDIAFSGKPEEYALAEDFIHRLSEALSISEDRLFIIPGNHDIDLDLEEDAVAGARIILTSSQEVDRFLGNESRRRTVFARERAFREFANRFSSTPLYTSSSYAHTRTLQLRGVRIRVLMLDSAWLAGGGDSDTGTLLLGERQVLDCVEPPDGCLTFALIHHPFAWLQGFEQVPVENLVIGCAQICLRGHVHSPDLREVGVSSRRLTTFTAGAAFQDRTAQNTYDWCSVDLTTGSGERIIHRYNHPQHRWDQLEPAVWTLPSTPPALSDVSQVRSELVRIGVPFPSYMACAICSLQTEVPLALPSGRVAYVHYATAILGSRNECGELVHRLQQHFSWKRIWERAEWEAQLRRIGTDLTQVLGQLAKTDGQNIEQRDAGASGLIDATTPGARIASPVCDELHALLRDRDSERARQVFERWQGQDILSASEARELARLEILLLLAEGDRTQANAKAERLIQSTDCTPDDLALAARTAHEVADHARASRLMHDALDAGILVETVRVTALRIAGASGDSRLTDRVRT